MISKEDLDQMKLVFVTREECDITVDKLNRDIQQHNVDLALIKNDLAAIKKIGWLTFSLLVTAVFGALLALIL